MRVCLNMCQIYLLNRNHIFLFQLTTSLREIYADNVIVEVVTMSSQQPGHSRKARQLMQVDGTAVNILTICISVHKRIWEGVSGLDIPFSLYICTL
jgi:hypothetical protein